MMDYKFNPEGSADNQSHHSTQEVQQASEQHDSNATDVLHQELNQWKDKALRAHAEFDNYKKRQEKERQQHDYFIQRQILLPLLPIIDNFGRARNQSADMPASMKNWVEGIAMIAKDLDKYLRSQGLEQIATQGIFDPEIHEAVAQVTDSEHQSGTIVETFEHGYRFKDRVLRPAKVSVAA